MDSENTGEIESVSHAMGNPMSYIDGEWIIDETGERYWDKEVWKNLKCTKCGEKPTKDDHDPCISNLKDVEYACCGHGIDTINGVASAYIKFDNGKSIRFKTTEELLEYVKKNNL